MASGRPIVGEKDRSTAIVPIRIAADHIGDREDPRLSDVDEWGRSERTRALARAMYEPIYSKWFRTEWEGLEKIPAEGGALLVANHAGAIPSDAPVIMHGIEKELGRPVYGLADYFFRTVPVIGTLWARSGGVSARPANAYRLLKEQHQLALVFPEGTKGTSKSFTDRYQLRRFGRGGFVEIAMRAGVPVIPIAVVGAEEAMPVVLRLPTVARALGAPLFPHHGQPARPRAPRNRHPVPRQVQAARAASGVLRRPGGPGPVLEEPDHGGVRAHPVTPPGIRVRHAARPAQRLVRLRVR